MRQYDRLRKPKSFLKGLYWFCEKVPVIRYKVGRNENKQEDIK